MNKPINNDKSSNDILLKNQAVNFSCVHKHVIFKMRIGKLWEEVILLYGFEKLETGLDLIHHERKIVIELKNSWKSDNFSGKQYKFYTLRNYKRDHPEYEVIYGCINDYIIRDYVNKDGVRILTSDAFLGFIFGNQSEFVVNSLRSMISVYLTQYPLL